MGVLNTDTIINLSVDELKFIRALCQNKILEEDVFEKERVSLFVKSSRLLGYKVNNGGYASEEDNDPNVF